VLARRLAERDQHRARAEELGARAEVEHARAEARAPRPRPTPFFVRGGSAPHVLGVLGVRGGSAPSPPESLSLRPHDGPQVEHARGEAQHSRAEEAVAEARALREDNAALRKALAEAHARVPAGDPRVGVLEQELRDARAVWRPALLPILPAGLAQ